MSDEKTEVKTEASTVVAEAVAELAATPDPVVDRAMEQGWVPLEDWKASGREESEWRPAKEFVERGELYKSIHTTKKELKQTQAALSALQRHHQYVFEKAHQQAVRDLKAEKRLAIRNEDFDRLEEIETEIEELTEQHVKEKAVLTEQQVAAQNAGPAPEFQAFVDKNPWYLTDKTLRDEADAVGFVYLNNGGTKDTLLQHVEKEMKRKFPDKFGVKKAAPNAVAGVNRTAKKGNEVTMNDVPEHMREVIRNFTQSTGMSEADYIKELKKIGAF